MGRYEVNELKYSDVCDNFKQQLHEKMFELDIYQEDTIDGKWKTIKETIKVITITIRGKQKKMKKPRFNSFCEEALYKRKEARIKLLNDSFNREKEIAYKERQNKANNILKSEKRKYAKYILEEVETHYRAKKTRELYQKIKLIRDVYKKNEKFLKNEEGILVTEQDKVLEKKRQYFGQLLNYENSIETFI